MIGGFPRSFWDLLDAIAVAILIGLIGTLVVGALAGDSTWPVAVRTIAIGSILYGLFLVLMWFFWLVAIARYGD